MGNVATGYIASSDSFWPFVNFNIVTIPSSKFCPTATLVSYKHQIYYVST